MGQRLVIHIMNGSDELANAYYHWDAYTETARGHVDEILNYYFDNIDIFTANFDSVPRRDKEKFAIWLLESTGASVSYKAAEEIERLFSTEKKVEPRNPDRNNGIIEITKGEMASSTDNEEGYVTIDLKEGSIYFGVYYIREIEDLEYVENNSSLIYTYDRTPKIAASDSGSDPAYFHSFEEWATRSDEFFKDLMAGCIYDDDRNGFYRDIS